MVSARRAPGLSRESGCVARVRETDFGMMRHEDRSDKVGDFARRPTRRATHRLLQQLQEYPRTRSIREGPTMVRLRDLMTTDILTVGPETSLREAMELLGRHHVSGAPVVASGNLVGVVTATDLMAFISSLPGVPTERDATDALDFDELIPEPSEDDIDGNAFFTEFWDDAGADVVEREASITTPEWNSLEEHEVSEAMTCAPLRILPPDADARLAAALMANERIHRVLVTEGTRLVGIVSSLDIAKAVAEHKIVERTYVFGAGEAFGR
jgi:CBS domain-containing protein